MLKEYEEELLPEFFRELRQAQEEMDSLPGRCRWLLRAELPSGYGIVSRWEMLIFRPLQDNASSTRKIRIAEINRAAAQERGGAAGARRVYIGIDGARRRRIGAAARAQPGGKEEDR